jgi:hypothetical protein
MIFLHYTQVRVSKELKARADKSSLTSVLFAHKYESEASNLFPNEIAQVTDYGQTKTPGSDSGVMSCLERCRLKPGAT